MLGKHLRSFSVVSDNVDSIHLCVRQVLLRYRYLLQYFQFVDRLAFGYFGSGCCVARISSFDLRSIGFLPVRTLLVQVLLVGLLPMGPYRVCLVYCDALHALNHALYVAAHMLAEYVEHDVSSYSLDLRSYSRGRGRSGVSCTGNHPARAGSSDHPEDAAICQYRQ